MSPTAPRLRGNDEADVSTEQQTTETNARVSRPHGHAGWPPSDQATPRKGPQAVDSHHPGQAAGLTGERRSTRLPKAHRIRRRDEFLRLQRVGRRRSGRHFVVITSTARNGRARLGITTSRKVGPAVVRNRIRRFVREVFRRHSAMIVPPKDIIVIARPSAASAAYEDVRRELTEALHLHGVGRSPQP
jgi:ribonuclease P protein component